MYLPVMRVWLETAVQCPGDAGYTTLLPRQPITTVPYALGLRPGVVMQSAEPGDAFYVEKTATNSNAIHGKSTATGSIGVWGEGVDNTGVYGLSQGGKGVWGSSTSESGVFGISDSWAGVWGESTGASGVVGMSAAQYSAGVWGENTGQGYGVYGKSPDNVGVRGESTTWAGVWGSSTGASGVVGVSAGQYNGGVYGENTGLGYGVYGKSPDGLGVYGQSTSDIGVYGKSTSQTGVVGESSGHDGVRGTTTGANRIGVKGVADATGAVGVWGESVANTGVYGQSGSASGVAIWGKNTEGGVAGRFEGSVEITGGADLAERFQIRGDIQVEPGTLLVIDTENPGHLAPSRGVYDFPRRWSCERRWWGQTWPDSAPGRRD